MKKHTQQPILFFIRHGKLALPYKNHAAMPREVLIALGLKQLDPSIEKKFIDEQIQLFLKSNIPLASIQQIYTSPSRRCIETADYLNNYIQTINGQRAEQSVSPNLREVYFELDKIFSANSASSNINFINNAVLTAMSINKFCESTDSCLARIATFFAKRHDFLMPTIIVTHDFIMRVIELFIRQQGIISCPITLEHLLSTQRNDYLHGFATDSQFLSFKQF